MSAHKNIDRICCFIIAVLLMITVIFCNGKALGVGTAAHAAGYENRIFDRSRVHSLDIVIDDWDGFLETCESEEYSSCSVVIDGEAVKNVAIRGKGNTSLSSVKNMDSSRYSFKLEFDHYEKGKSYHGLDKLCLNNVIQDNTYMKDYLAYTLMYDFGVDAPLCSYAYITVNGEDWGLYLAVEAIEDSFLERNYGSNYGELYKPDSMSFGGGGPGNGKDFRMSEFMKNNSDDENTDNGNFTFPADSGGGMPDPASGEGFPSAPPDLGSGEMPQSDKGNVPGMPGSDGGFGGMGSSDVKLQYIDDNTDSYSNIFNNAKTDVSTADKNRLIRSLKALSEQSDIENTVDVDEVIRYFVVHDFLCNGDSYTGMMIHNYYLYEKDGQLSMIPWDYNLGYGSFQGNDASSSVNSPIDTPVSGGMSDRPMISWIFDSAEYTEKYHQLFSEFIDSCGLDERISGTAELIEEYVEKDPTRFCTYEEFQKGVSAISDFCTLREESVRGQLNGTIPSTSDGQKADCSALVETGSLTVSDMGSMNNGGFGGGFGGGAPGRDNRNADAAGTSGNDSKNSAPEGFDPSQMPGDLSGEKPEGFGGDFPEGFDPSQMPGDLSGEKPEGFGGNIPEGFDPSQKPGDLSGEKPEISGDKTTGDNDADDHEIKAAETASAENESTEETPSPKAGGNNFAAADNNRQPPENVPGMMADNSADDRSSFIILGVCSAVLLFGIIFAVKFKR